LPPPLNYQELTTSTANGIGTFRSRLKTNLFVSAYVTLRICNPAPVIGPILALYKTCVLPAGSQLWLAGMCHVT